MAYRQPRKKKEGSAPKKVKKKAKQIINVDPWNQGWAVGTNLIGFSRGRWRKAKVVHRKSRRPSADNPHKFEYYVHYYEFNRRMDQWVGWDRLLTAKQFAEREGADELAVIEARAAATSHGHGDKGGDHGHKKSVHSKGVDKSGDTVMEFIEGDHDGHDGMDEASLKEHEEVTKVK